MHNIRRCIGASRDALILSFANIHRFKNCQTCSIGFKSGELPHHRKKSNVAWTISLSTWRFESFTCPVGLNILRSQRLRSSLVRYCEGMCRVHFQELAEISAKGFRPTMRWYTKALRVRSYYSGPQGIGIGWQLVDILYSNLFTGGGGSVARLSLTARPSTF